ncbi:hypothetical protein HYQ45_008498 [Verticillium longisporum]|uniref:Uncharacterized protein n=1 Tax=Verticillium longisporum TaxID=100787 RepID=A0A8I2ZMH3_VERLO|nr:hypothetical protein HYQ45_008498 [Verticillium longisporum]
MTVQADLRDNPPCHARACEIQSMYADGRGSSPADHQGLIVSRQNALPGTASTTPNARHTYWLCISAAKHSIASKEILQFRPVVQKPTS